MPNAQCPMPIFCQNRYHVYSLMAHIATYQFARLKVGFIFIP
ncbi:MULTISPECIES: hypothetical protein [unclassified Calothrix]|nr:MULTISPECIES: hypothetical protein [unclassified Calothrix]